MTTTDPSTGTTGPPERRTRTRTIWTALAAAAIVLALAAGGTVAYRSLRSTPSPTPTASPSPTPSFSASESPSVTPTTQTPEGKAAVAAETAYRTYIQVVDRVGQAGGQGADQLKNVAIQEELLAQQYSASQYRSNGWHVVGNTEVVSLEVVSVSLKTDPKTFAVPEVVLRPCEDVTNAYAIDKAGKPVRPSSAPTHYLWTVNVRYYPDRGGVDGWFVAKATGKGVAQC
jgi:hypothetical protein